VQVLYDSNTHGARSLFDTRFFTLHIFKLEISSNSSLA
jgi:hypothetical protein